MNRRILTAVAGAAALLASGPLAAQVEQPPTPGPLRPFALPAPQEFRLANGLRVVVVEDHGLPVVHGRVLVNAGSVLEPAEKNGLASLTGQLLREGTGTHTGSRISEEMEKLGAQFGTDGELTFATAQVTSLKSRFPEALALAATTVMDPTFPDAEFTRVRNQMVAAHQRRQSTVEGLGITAYNRAVYDSTSGYSRPVRGTAATLGTITRDDVVAFHRRMFGPANSTLILVGDVTVPEARRMAEAALGRWTAPAQAVALPRPAPPAAGATRIILIDRPGSVQSGLFVGQPTRGAEDPELLPMLALSNVLGGGFGARINMLLREAKGWTYGAFAGLTYQPGAGDLVVSSSVRTNATDSAVAAVVSEYRRIAAEPVPADELRRTIQNVVGSFPASIQTVQGLAGRVQTLLQNGFPLSYYADYRERLAAITPADISRAARSRLTPGSLTVVVAGDLATVEAPIRALNLGAVEVWDANGNRVR